MDIRKLQRVIVDGLEDVKAQDILVFNTEHLSPLFERVIVASGTSNRQTKSLAASVREAVKSAGAPIPRTEGEENGEWIVVDCGAAVVHVMQPAIREYYHLEELWGEKPVRMKIGGGEPTRLVKASPVTPAREASKTAGARRPPPAEASQDARPRRAAAPKRHGTSSRGASTPGGASEGRPVPAKRSSSTRSTSPRPAPAKSAPAKRAPGKSASAKSASAKSAAKRAPAKRAPAKQASIERRAVPAKARNSGR